MKQRSKFEVSNTSQSKKMIVLEPWAEIFEVLPSKTLEFVGQSQVEGEFEIEFNGEHEGSEWLTIYAWASSTVKVFMEDENISSVGHIEVPAFLVRVFHSSRKICLG